MLAQNFKTPKALKIGDDEFAALVKVLGMLERGELVHIPEPSQSWDAPTVPNAFHMTTWECGTAACIGGWAERVGRIEFRKYTDGLNALFYPGSSSPGAYEATPSQAAMALRNYLTHGKPRWKEAMASL